jgi:hypothetical protein
MRDSRNVLHARLATARTKQKHNCGGINERVRANYRGVGNPQNRREPPGRYHAEKAHDQPVGKPSEKIRELLRQNDEPVSYGRSGEDSRWVRTVCQDSASCFGARRNSYFGGFKGGWKRWSTAT